MWLEVVLKSWREFEKIVSTFPRGQWIYRGQSNAEWKIVTSLYREFDKVHMYNEYLNKEIELNYNLAEMEMTRDFISSYNLYSSHTLPDPRDQELKEQNRYYLESWSLMQHYGAPTRLLDWTYSPYIGAFFAVDGASSDFCIYALRIKDFSNYNHRLVDENNELLVKPEWLGFTSSASYFKVYEPARKNERIRRQQGLFLVSNENYEQFDEILINYQLKKGKINGEGELVAYKFVFPKKFVLDTWDNLQRMNINHETLYSGMEGFGRSIKLGLLNINNILFLQSKK
ncbi:FRG domain-containing protein [Paenibacillus polysaccharolyticus]|uniref:FRG domain-containing protein n=1 Tax=Paenibacillus polysaccharolyticus TaxID=582692 RepID=A0A1G5ASM8_9BACL|nr:FRG domain-containing protein [Paenibacillus polysaccharolyticus]SCX80903.1 FRG domain-containing protein [Paenibacillus polysaccharolyticus]